MDETRLRKLCSDVTLQSQKEGFFNQWADQIEEYISSEDLNHFERLTSDKERFAKIWEHDFVHSLQIQSFFASKNHEVSEEKRTEGNKAFQANKNEKALQLYSQAVIRAPSTGTDLSLALANRSAALFHCRNYELCLQDTSLALAQGYPARLKYKVLDRRGQCFAKLGQMEEAKEAYEQAIEAVKDSDLEDNKRKLWVKELRSKIEKCVTSSNEKKEVDDNIKEDIYQEQLFRCQSSVLPKASSSLTLKFSSETGRYMAASEYIPALKVLVREKPFSSVVIQEKRGSFCENCFKKLIAPIPCSTCSGVAFCSTECLSLASNTYHKWECPYLNLFKASGMSLNCFLSLRVITERGLRFFTSNFSEELKNTELPSEQFPHNPDDYKTFYNLVGLEDLRDRKDFLRRTLMVVFLLKVLQHAGFFKRKSNAEYLGEDELLIGSLLLRHLQVIQFNAHEVSGIAYEGKKSFQSCKSVYLGLAVYPTISFFNHSCCPAVGRYFNGKEMTIVNLRPLKKGEMVAENYGPVFTHSSLEERQKKLLSRYWFSCKCEACESNWPKYEKMTNTIVILKGENSSEEQINQNEEKRENQNKKKRKKKKNVTKEKKEEDNDLVQSVRNDDFTTDAHKDFELGKTLMDENKREEAISAYRKWVETVWGRVQLPLKDYYLALQALRLLVASRGSSYVNDK